MELVRRTAIVRVIAIVGLAASTVLTVDHLVPGRAYCPLADACAAAAASELGSLFGVPTALLGMGAFAAFFLLTLLPPVWVRRLVPPAGILAGMGGVGLFTYQLLQLDALCPVCLFADGAGVMAGLATIAWPELPYVRSGRQVSMEATSSRVAWTLGCALVVVVPLALPRAEDPGWVAIAPIDEGTFERAEARPRVAATWRPAPALPPQPAPVEAPVPAVAAEPAALPVTSVPTASVPTPSEAPAAGEEALLLVAMDAEAIAVLDEVTPSLAEPASPPSKPTAAPRAEAPRMVEYLNAFCVHCRATHRRLDRVLDEMQVPLRRLRVYTWRGGGYPLWARACAAAGRVGREDVLFCELMKARSDTPREVYAAARRAGIDTRWLRAELTRDPQPARLVRDRRWVEQARLRALPTIDIGRRRLAGAQSEEELRAAIRAALTQLNPDGRG